MTKDTIEDIAWAYVDESGNVNLHTIAPTEKEAHSLAIYVLSKGGVSIPVDSDSADLRDILSSVTKGKGAITLIVIQAKGEH